MSNPGKSSRSLLAAIVFSVTFASVGAVPSHEPGHANATYSSKWMADGKQWMTENLHLATPDSYCYDNLESNCRRYGRLYTWVAAQSACRSLAGGWRLPTNEDWQRMAKQYGGVRDDSDDGGQAAFRALITGGSSGFNAVFGGGRSQSGEYARLEGHGLYWTASESDAATAWVYNFGQARILNRHRDVEKQRAFSVRCVRD